MVLCNSPSLSSEPLSKSGVLDEWANMALRTADSMDNDKERIAALAFLADVWVTKADTSEDINDLA